MRTSCGSSENPPARSASPFRKDGDCSSSCGGTKPKTSAISPRSRGEFIRISPRLSHCDSTLAWIFVGRCVERKSQRPNLRPSAAIWMICSVSAASTAVRGFGGQKLCASSITISIGRRSIRCIHRCSSTQSAAACGSAVWVKPPTSRTVTRGRSSRTSVADAPPNAQSGQSRISRLSMRSPRRRCAMSPELIRAARNRSFSKSVTALFRCSSALYSSSSAIGSSRPTAACECTVRSTNRACSCSPSAVLLWSTRMSRARKRSADSASASSRVCGQPHVIGVRVEDGDGQLGLEHQLLEHDTERVGLARPALAAPEGVTVEAGAVDHRRLVRVRRARAHGQRNHRAPRFCRSRFVRAASRAIAARISARWVNACGKLPSCSPVGSISSANRPTWLP